MNNDYSIIACIGPLERNMIRWSCAFQAADGRTEKFSLQGEGVATSAKPPIASDGKAEEFCGNILRYHKIPASKSNPSEKGQENPAEDISRGSDGSKGAQHSLPFLFPANASLLPKCRRPGHCQLHGLYSQTVQWRRSCSGNAIAKL